MVFVRTFVLPCRNAVLSKSMQTVVFVLPSFAGGGAERVMLKLANGLDRDRFAGRIVVLEESGPLRDDVDPHIPVQSLDCRRVRTALVPLRRTLKKISPEFVVTTMGYLNLSVLMIGAVGFPRTRFIVREANEPEATLRAFRWPSLIRTLYKVFYPRAQAVACPSQAILEKLAGEFSIPINRMHLLRNPVDVVKIRSLAAKPLAANKAITFVASGRLTEQKGFDRLLNMFAELPGEIRLRILGDGPLRSQLQCQANELGVSDRIEFLGFQNNPWCFYAAADAFLLPSRWEGMPNVALESLACGTPVIATPEAGGIGEVAALAVEGAVQLATVGPAFVAAMNSITPRTETTPCPSLLPDVFSLPVVENNFMKLLSNNVAN